MKNLKIRNMKDKIEIEGITYCIGENEVFTGIFVDKLENIFEGSETKETYNNGIIVKKEVFKRFYTRENVYKMFLVKSTIYEKGNLLQEKTFEYNKYGELKREITPNENTVKYYDSKGNISKKGDVGNYEATSFLKKVIFIIVIILIFSFPAILESNSNSSSKNYETKNDTYYMKELEREVNRQLNDTETRRQLEKEAKEEIEKAKKEMGI